MLAALNQRFENWVTSRHKPQPSPVEVLRGRCYILPTRPGYIFSFMLLAMLMGAMNYSNSLAFALTFLLGGMALVAMHHTNSNLLGIQVHVQRVAPVFSGEPIWVPIRYFNPSQRTRHALLCGLKRAELSPDSAADCPANDSGDSGFELAAKTRGVYRLPRFCIATEFPLGLFNAWSWITLSTQLIVYPQPSQTTRPIPPVAGSQGKRAGSQDGSDDFSHLRDYREGDGLKLIHWKRFGHTGQLAVKAFSEPMEESLWLDWSTLEDIRETEARLAQLCRWVLDCEAEQKPYGLRMPGGIVEPGNGSSHQSLCLEMLARHGESEPAA